MIFRFYKGRGTMSKMINMLERLKIVEKAENEKKEGGANQIKPLENHNEKQSTSDMYQQVQNNVNTKTVKPASREESNSGYEKISYDKNKSIEEIYEKVWNEPAYNPDTVTVHIRRIREKIEINPKEPKYLKVVWGIGYKFEG